MERNFDEYPLAVLTEINNIMFYKVGLVSSLTLVTLHTLW